MGRNYCSNFTHIFQLTTYWHNDTMNS